MFLSHADARHADLSGASRIVTTDAGIEVYYPGDADPYAAPSIAMRRIITASDFRARFTDAEMAAIITLAYSGAGDVNSALLLLKLQTSNDIDLDSGAVAHGLAYLTAKGALPAGRAAEILA